MLCLSREGSVSGAIFNHIQPSLYHVTPFWTRADDLASSLLPLQAEGMEVWQTIQRLFRLS